MLNNSVPSYSFKRHEVPRGNSVAERLVNGPAPRLLLKKDKEGYADCWTPQVLIRRGGMMPWQEECLPSWQAFRFFYVLATV